MVYKKNIGSLQNEHASVDNTATNAQTEVIIVIHIIIRFHCGVPHVQHLSLLPSHVSDRATNPLNRDTDWSSIHAFCDQLNSDLEG